MFMPQTMFEYLENPMGKGSTAISNRKLIKDDLDNRLKKLLDKHKDFKKYFYHDAHNFYIHFIIPSESDRENTYDIVIQFFPSEPDMINDMNLNRYSIKVFSNCPSFTYTYAYVYNDYDLLIDFLKNKYDNIVLSNNPVIKNPGEVINFEKSIYFACKYLENNKGLLNKISWSTHSNRINIKEFSNKIRNTAKIELEIKKEQSRISEKKEKEKEEARKKIEKLGQSKLRSTINVITGTKQVKKRNDHKVTPHSKISGKPKLKKTINKK